MKRVKLSVTALMLGGVLGSLPTAYAEGVGGTITFVGRVVEGPCQVSVNHGEAIPMSSSESAAFTLDLTGCPASSAAGGVAVSIEPLTTTPTDKAQIRMQRQVVAANAPRAEEGSLSYGVSYHAVSPGSRNAIYTLQYK